MTFFSDVSILLFLPCHLFYTACIPTCSPTLCFLCFLLSTPSPHQRSQTTTLTMKRRQWRALCLTWSYTVDMENTLKGRRLLTRCEPMLHVWILCDLIGSASGSLKPFLKQASQGKLQRLTPVLYVHNGINFAFFIFTLTGHKFILEPGQFML